MGSLNLCIICPYFEIWWLDLYFSIKGTWPKIRYGCCKKFTGKNKNTTWYYFINILVGIVDSV